ncbi:MAG TPA: DNA polymerase [Acidimicrobiales bacterium]
MALALAPGVGLGLAAAGGRLAVAAEDARLAAVVEAVEREVRPRWVVWSPETAATMVAEGVRVATCWDVAAVARLLFGGWRADPALVWARLHDLPDDTVPAVAPLDLFSQAAAAGERNDGDAVDDPVRGDGHLRPEWVDGGWAADPDRLAAWAAVALVAAERQRARLARLDTGAPAPPGAAAPVAPASARSESTAELLCAELAADGLPVDRAAAERIIAGFVGPRPRSEAEAAAQRVRRDAEVLRHAPEAGDVDLRSPAQVRSLLRRVGVEVPDTRAWRLERLRDAHPVVGALLAWRKAERIATTYGYAWLDRHVGADGRLRGAWTASDGAAGRMTASAGLHNMPADLRAAVAAEPGHVFVRADLGQVEPRVLAAVSGDAALARAAADDDLYAPVAARMGVDRATAKVAVLGAMYGQTTGHGAQVLPRLVAAFPVAMAYLDAADRAGQAGRDLRTHGGRLVRLGPVTSGGMSEREARRRAAARGRYARNAMVQGAAAELFKMWAVTVRARSAPLGARIVLCLHDELLVHVPAAQAGATAGSVVECLSEAVQRWAPGTPVRFVADVATVARWSDAKA